jgi:hypothetical protein
LGCGGRCLEHSNIGRVLLLLAVDKPNERGNWRNDPLHYGI